MEGGTKELPICYYLRQQNSKEMVYKGCQKKGPNENLLIARFWYLCEDLKKVMDFVTNVVGVYIIREKKEMACESTQYK